MDYNNFLLRLLFSSFFILIYCIFAYINFKYIYYLIFLIYILIFIEIYLNFKGISDKGLEKSSSIFPFFFPLKKSQK